MPIHPLQEVSQVSRLQQIFDLSDNCRPGRAAFVPLLQDCMVRVRPCGLMLEDYVCQRLRSMILEPAGYCLNNKPWA